MSALLLRQDRTQWSDGCGPFLCSPCRPSPSASSSLTLLGFGLPGGAGVNSPPCPEPGAAQAGRHPGSAQAHLLPSRLCPAHPHRCLPRREWPLAFLRHGTSVGIPGEKGRSEVTSGGWLPGCLPPGPLRGGGEAAGHRRRWRCRRSAVRAPQKSLGRAGGNVWVGEGCGPQGRGQVREGFLEALPELTAAQHRRDLGGEPRQGRQGRRQALCTQTA